MKKIYNTAEETTVQKAVLEAKERFDTANEVGLKSGTIAAGITCAISSVDNISACINGESAHLGLLLYKLICYNQSKIHPCNTVLSF